MGSALGHATALGISAQAPQPAQGPVPRRVVLLIRGICKGEPATVLAEELSLSRQCVHRWRKRIQTIGDTMLSPGALPDRETEADEMFQNAG